jgi:hypothetical protein
MISTFFYGLLTDRAYLLHWDEHNPLPLETVWEQPSINWTHNPVEMEKLFNLKNELLGYQKVAMLNQKLPVITKTILPKGSNTDFNRIWNQTFVQVRSNRGYIVNVFNHHKGYAQKLNELGLTKENAFKCITNYLFRPTIGARRFLNAYKHAFQMDSILSIGIQIRTDDSALADPSKDINDLDKWSHFFRCASELAQYKIKPNQHVVFFLITDSQHLRDQFALLNDDKQLSSVYFGDIAYKSTMVVTGLPIEHIEIDQVSKKYGTAEQRKKANIERMLPGSNSAYIENWLLAYTKYRVISPQGYGKMAAFYSGYDYTTISIPKQPSPPPTCSNEEAFISYDWLSEQWSLG